MNLYPLKFKPIYKERIWGGTKLNSELNKDAEGDLIGESWELSDVKGDVSIISNGNLQGRSLEEVIQQSKEELLGKSVVERFGNKFPVLIKFIDAKQDLSIQLHPHDDLAMKRHNSFGKTEMWYIMQADPGAKLIVGFNKDVSKEEYVQHLQGGTLLDILNYETVKEGDTFFINTGKIHAIGAGVLLAEIQQTSDITYRVYDFNRKDKDGNTRELHTELAVDAIDYKKKDDFKVKYEATKNKHNNMVACKYFTTNYLDINGKLTVNLEERDSFTIYMCVSGSAQIDTSNGSETIQRGETILIPAAIKNLDIKAGSAKLLEVYI
ncbi:type I phosphomannose isomerase catalytic subunit [Abyssalbus ytuae]|uniref:Phosphohexomutase n=1 Tax=Abyssalbus ytuae TaxID=2926907 RepID=A0A9E6ZQG0_9FLAO|nr:type I phosphomannose isomerase catalytic subunit [Abyssalbus ytuae]UOB16893.1 class I mannose-6-phosphate isomerase [Abyssalbus ytuae]